MKQYQTFSFDSFSLDPVAGKIELTYALDDDVTFREHLTLPGEWQVTADPHSPVLIRALRALHLAGGISYYKTCLPKKIDVRTGDLTEKQAIFWNTVYEKGLGEFFFKNDIDFRGLINFPAIKQPATGNPQPNRKQSENGKKAKKILVPVGGGKDSTVTLELLKDAGYDCTLLRVGGHPLIERIAETAGLPLLTVARSLPKELFALNAAGALNGHVPITMYLSFLAVVIAELYGFDAVVWSSERSASEGNTVLHGMEVNHQWSKALEAERLFRSYVQTFVGSGVESFSLLRPFSELAIAQRFAAFPQYFACTTSCNKNWKLNPKSDVRSPNSSLWCGTCPKCAFVFALYAAYLPKETLLTVFGKNLFDDTSLLPLYRQLLGLEGTKPFECVGTPEETQAAFLLAQRRGEWDGASAMALFERESLPSVKDPKRLIDEALAPKGDHCIPPPFAALIPGN